MALHDIINYLEANRGKYPREVLIAQLQKSGYPEEEIKEAFQKINSGSQIPSSLNAKKKFSVGGFLLGLFLNLFLLAAGLAGVVFLFLVSVFGGKTLFESQGLAILGIVIIVLVLPFFLFFRLREKYPNYARGAVFILMLDGAVLILGFFGYLYLLGSRYF